MGHDPGLHEQRQSPVRYSNAGLSGTGRLSPDESTRYAIRQQLVLAGRAGISYPGTGKQDPEYDSALRKNIKNADGFKAIGIFYTDTGVLALQTSSLG